MGAFSVIVKTGCGTDGALHSTTLIGCREEAAGRFEGTPAGLVGPRLELRWGRVDTFSKCSDGIYWSGQIIGSES